MDIISYNKAASVQKDLDNRVLTDVPENAVFTDTTYVNISELTNDVGYLTSFTETDPVFTAWDKSTGITITESQISDLGNYEPVDVTILRNADIGVSVQSYNVNTVIDSAYVHTDNNYTTTEKTKLGTIESGAQVNTVDSVSGKTGVVTLTKNDVALDQVDNTSDLDKPISTATQAALDTKTTINAVASDVSTYSSNTIESKLSGKLGADSPEFIGTPIEDTYTLTGTVIDPSNGSQQYVNLTGNVTYTETLVDGQGVELIFDGAATYVVTLPTITWITSKGNIAPIFNGTKDTLTLWKQGSTLYGSVVGHGGV